MEETEMTEQELIRGGLQNIPQIVYLDFDGAETVYRNTDLNISINVEVEDSSFSREEQQFILNQLSEKYSDSLISFTTEMPVEGPYSTIFIGTTDAFAQFEDFQGIAETIDKDNRIKDDDAFVFADSRTDLGTAVSIIEHELGHIVFGEEHTSLAGDLRDYALSYSAGTISSYYSNSGTLDISDANPEDNYAFKVSSSGTYTINVSFSNNNKCSARLKYYDANGEHIIQLSSGQNTLSLSAGTQYYLYLRCAVNSTDYYNDYTYSFSISKGGSGGGSSGGGGSSYHDLIPFTPRNWSAPIVASTVTGTSTDASVITTDDDIYVDVAAINSMTANISTPFQYTLYVDGTAVKNWTVSSLQSGYYNYAEDYNIGKLSSGNHTLQLYVDSTNAISETNESNNVYTKSIYVSQAADTQSPSTPVNLTWAVGDGVVYLDWDDSTDNTGVAGYEIRYQHEEKTGGTPTPQTVLYSNFLQSLDGMKAGSYWWQVRAFDANGNYSDWSAKKTFDIPAVINSDGRVKLYSGTSLVSAADTVTYASAGGYSTVTRIDVTSGGVIQNTAVGSSGFLYVMSGGRADTTNISGLNASCWISSSGAAVNTRVYSGGDFTVFGGAAAAGTTVKSKGEAHVYDGGYISRATIKSGGYLNVYDGATATAVKIEDGGRLLLEISSDTNIQGTSNGSAFQANNGTVSDFTVNYDDRLRVFTGAIADNIHVKDGGRIFVSSGGCLTGTLNMDSGAYVHGYSGALFNFDITDRSSYDTALYNDLSLIGGTPTYYVMVSSCQKEGEYKLAAGAGSFTGSVSVYDTGAGYIGTLTVNGSSITYGNNVYSLKKNNGTLVLALDDLTTKSNTSSVQLCTNGSCQARGSSVTGMNISAGQILKGYTGAVINNTTVNQNGSAVVYNGGKVQYSTVNNRGSIILSSGAAAENTVINSGGGLHVYSGGVAADTTVTRSGYFGVGLGAATYDTTIDYAGELTVWGGGKVYRNTINQWGAIILSSGALADSTTINSQGGLHVYSGAVASNTTVKQGGFFGVGLGATTYNTLIDYAGELTVWGGGLVNDNEINQWGAIILSSGAAANRTVINPDGGLHIYNGATAYTTQVTSGAKLGIGYGGYLYGADLENTGTMTFYEGARIGGWNDLEGTVITSGGVDASGAYINFELGERSDDQTAILDNIGNFYSVQRYSMEVDADQASGYYILANGATYFNDRITLYVEDGNDCGSLACGESLDYDGKRYSLTNNSGILALHIS